MFIQLSYAFGPVLSAYEAATMTPQRSCGSIRQRFVNLHHLVSVIAHPNDGICTHLRGVMEDQVERVSAGLFAEVCKGSNIPTDGCV
jgi:hypothetical protein